jgi:outer membrane protein, multidrug efflux system
MQDKAFIKIWIRRFCYAYASSLFFSCQLLAPYKSPLTPTPDNWKIPEKENSILPSAKSTQNEIPKYEEVKRDLYNWWEIFDDPTLNELEEQALESSYNLWAALERVIEARAQARIQFSPLLPTINFAPAFSRSGSLFQNPFTGLLNSGATNGCISGCQLGGTGANATATQANTGDFRFVQSQYLVPLTFQYEIDLWGQLRGAFYAATMRAQAASQAYLSVLLSLTADVASTYFRVRGFDTQQKVIQNNILVRKNALDIAQARYTAGIVLYLDVSRAQVELARAYGDSAETYRLRGLQENMLATLVGVPAPVFKLDYSPIYQEPPEVPAGIPSELLTRRPDVMEAERNLAASYEDIGVAYANFFPSLNLNAAYGFESPFAFQLLNWRSRFWEVGFNILQTVFDAGRNEANYDYYRARFSETMAKYQQTVLGAFQDVEDSLVNLRGSARRGIDFAAAVESARITLNLAKMRYTQGLINYLDVVDAERQLLETEQTVAAILQDRYVYTIALIRALGGSWDSKNDLCSFNP